MALEVKRAMILAAGLGKRMRSHASDRPKPLVEVLGRTLIDRALDRLGTADVEDVVVNVHYKADMLRSHLAMRSHPNIILSEETDCLLDTGGGVKNALSHFGGEPFFTHNSDAIWIEDSGSALKSLAEAWNGDVMDALMLVAPLSKCTGYDGTGDFSIDEAGHLTRLDNQSTAYVWAGVQLIHPRAFEDTPDGAFSTNLIWDRLISNKRLYGVCLDGTWMHVGSAEGLKHAEALLEKQPDNDGR